jgi:UDP:flavonoid glycosyltransferase YjiC (YdhE family)
MREALRKHSKLRLEPQNWLPLPNLKMSNSPATEPISSPRIGFIIPADWPEATNAIAEMVKGETAITVHVWRDRGQRRGWPQTPGNWKVLDGAEISFAWFLRRIDALVVMQRPERPQLPEAIIAAAQSAGKPVLAPVAPLSEEPPPGVSMVDPRRIVATIRHLLKRPSGRPHADVGSERVANRLRKRFAKFAGTARRASPKKRSGGHKPRVLFLPKGGVGIGHVARLLAIARRCGNGFEPVIVSLSETVGLIEALGFTAEYIPSANYSGARPAEWNAWFQYELERLIDAYQSRAVVFDGSDPPATLSRAVASRNWCRGVWVRRGMWSQGFDPSLQRSGDYDLIIEPGELAAARDRGATAGRRHEAIQVEPITLLDRGELLSRKAAAAAIGLDPERPAALVQLGSGENRDILGLLDKIVAECRRYPELQLAIAQWANSAAPLNLWPGVKILNGAPLSLYYRAFDFSISAAGYNSFHELIGFGLPSLLVPNDAPDMDDQAARSAFAQDTGAAIELRDHEFDELPEILDLFMKPTFRSVMEANCNQLTKKNGADAASRVIAELVS